MRGLSLVVWLLCISCSTAANRSGSGPEGVPAHPLIGDSIGVDHVLVWSAERGAGEALWEQLGFRLTEKPGYYGAGISNRLIWFENVSFIEFLWLSDPELTIKEAPAEYALVQARNGSNAFGLQVADVDAAWEILAAAKLNPDKPGGEAYDPDGPEGPKEPVVNRWRFMFLAPGSLPGNPFFVEYNLPEGTPNPRHDQPNGAKRLSAVWVLVRNVDAAEAAYARVHFRRKRTVALPHLGLEGIALSAGDADILLLRPTGEGMLREQLERHGDHVVGMSIQVASLAVTQEVLQDRGAPNFSRQSGVYGPSLLSPNMAPLGVLIEFHE
jgi:hypothetical protein